jgi:hypothetical protein
MVELLQVDGRGFVGTVRGHDHAKEALRLHAEVVFDVGFHGAAESGLVGMLDSKHVGVAAAEKNIAKDRLFGSSAFDSVADAMDLCLGVSKVAPGEG